MRLQQLVHFAVAGWELDAIDSRTGAKKRSAAKRELIDTGTDKRFIRRNPKGRIKESDDVGRSLSGDRRRSARTRAARGQGDKGDR